MFLSSINLAENLNSVIDNADYQIVGIIVVLLCLGGLAVILTITGKIAAGIGKPKAATPQPAPAVKQAPAAPIAKPGEMTPETLAMIAAAIDSAMTELPPELVVVIAAAVDAALDGMAHRIVDIKQAPSGNNYAASGRAQIFASHSFTPTRAH